MQEKMDIDIVISYHTDSSKAKADAICNILESEGLRCWYAPRDVVGGTSYASAIVSAINTAKAIIIILNNEASRSPHVLNEIELAHKRLKEGIIIIPFRCEESEDLDLSDDAKYYLSRIHWLDGITPTFQDRVNDLAKSVKILLHMQRKTGDYSPMNGQNVPSARYELQPKENSSSIISTVINENIHFVGRSQIISTIHEALKKHPKFFLRGIGGIGKSQTVLQFIRLYRSEYDHVLFVKYKNSIMETFIDDSTAGICMKGFQRGEKEDAENYFTRKLNRLCEIGTKRMLIILDNYDVEYDPAFSRIEGLNCQMIITTRNDHQDSGLFQLDMKEMTEKEQEELLRSYSGNMVKENDHEEVVKQILGIASGHTLTIELIGKLMARQHKKPEDMLEMLRNKGIFQVLNMKVNSQETALNRIKSLFQISNLNADACYILTNMSLMPLDGIEFGQFLELCEIEDGMTLDDLIRSSWLQYDEVRDCVFMHPLIREVVISECKPDWKNCEKLMNHLINAVATGGIAVRQEKSKLQIYYQIAMSIYRVNPEISFCNWDYWKTVYTLSICLNQINREYWDDCTEYQIRNFGPYQRQTIFAYYVQSDLAAFQSDFLTSAAWLKKAYDATTAAFPNSIDRAYLLRFYADHIMRGNQDDFDRKLVKELFDKAQELTETATEDGMFRLLSERETWMKGTLYAAIAGYYLRIGENETAIEYADKCCRVFRQDPENTELFLWSSTPLMTKALACAKLSKKEEALQYAEEAYALRKKQYSENNLALLRLRVNYARVLHLLGEREATNKLLLEIKQILEEQQYVFTPLYQELVQMIENC